MNLSLVAKIGGLLSLLCGGAVAITIKVVNKNQLSGGDSSLDDETSSLPSDDEISHSPLDNEAFESIQQKYDEENSKTFEPTKKRYESLSYDREFESTLNYETSELASDDKVYLYANGSNHWLFNDVDEGLLKSVKCRLIDLENTGAVYDDKSSAFDCNVSVLTIDTKSSSSPINAKNIKQHVEKIATYSDIVNFAKILKVEFSGKYWNKLSNLKNSIHIIPTWKDNKPHKYCTYPIVLSSRFATYKEDTKILQGISFLITAKTSESFLLNQKHLSQTIPKFLKCSFDENETNPQQDCEMYNIKSIDEVMKMRIGDLFPFSESETIKEGEKYLITFSAIKTSEIMEALSSSEQSLLNFDLNKFKFEDSEYSSTDTKQYAQYKKLYIHNSDKQVLSVSDITIASAHLRKVHTFVF